MSKYFQDNTREYDFASAGKVTITGTSAQSAALPSSEVYLCSTTDCWLTKGANPTAVAAADLMLYLPAGCPLHMRITRGEKIAFIQHSAGGTVSVVPC
jgi:hypothetical protein